METWPSRTLIWKWRNERCFNVVTQRIVSIFDDVLVPLSSGRMHSLDCDHWCNFNILRSRCNVM